MRAKSTSALLGLCSLVAGCVSESRGYREVQDVVSERTQAQVKWRRIDEDPKREQAVQQLLRQPLTAKAAVQLGLLENLDIQAKFESLRAAQGKLLQARAPRNPEAEASFGFRRKHSTNVELSVSEELTNLLFLPGANRAAEAELDAESLAVATEVIDFVFDTERAFLRYQAAAKQLEIHTKLVAAERGQLEAARAIHAAGNITDLALLGFESSAREAEVALDGARQDASDKKEALTEQLGLWGKNVNFKVAPLTQGARHPSAPMAW
ncbi:MAG: TolC family protein [Polyangiaceae bacterium]|nr:TolC family protein [Polyangiaceae bacterium]